MRDETVQLWTERVAAWRASGDHADEFAEGKGFRGSTLRFWMSKLRRIAKTPRTKAISFVRVPKPSAAAVDVSVVVGDVRIEVPRVDEATLRLVLRVLREAR